MKLIHESLIENKLSILNNGLIPAANRPTTHIPHERDEKLESIEDISQGDVDLVIDRLRPIYLPEWMRLDNCLFFWTLEDYNRYIKLNKNTMSVRRFLIQMLRFGITLDSQDLDQDRLFALDNDTEILFQIALEVFEQNQGNSFSEDKIKVLVEKWWDNLIPFAVYEKYFNRIARPNTWPYCREILYFDKVPKELLKLRIKP